MPKPESPARYCPVCREDLTGVTEPLCPSCARPFDPHDPDTASPHAHAACLKCAYDLKGVDTGECPECGTAFDPLDEATYANPVTQQRKNRDRTFKILAFACLLLGLWFLAQRTIIPRPALRWNGDIVWTVWLWLDEPYGIWYDANDQRIRLWAGEAVRVDGGAATYTPPVRTALAGPVERPPGYERDAYTVTRHDDGTWTLDVRAIGVDWQRLLLAFNSTRTPDEVVGVQITRGGAPGNDEPFTVRGDGRDLLQALIDRYNLTTLPGTTLQDPDHVWVQNDENQLERVTLDDAIAMGFDPRPIDGDRIRRTTPRIR